jgi:hypothetical protein
LGFGTQLRLDPAERAEYTLSTLPFVEVDATSARSFRFTRKSWLFVPGDFSELLRHRKKSAGQNVLGVAERLVPAEGIEPTA